MDTHDYRIDRLRLLACFGVVLLHSSAGVGASDLALNALFRFSVPVFVIISGYFMLTRGDSTGALVQKAGLLFVKMVLCSGIYLLWKLASGGSLPERPIAYLLTSPIHLWYLYATMGLYLLTPALRPFVRSADRREYRYALGVCFALGCCVVTLVRLNWVPLLAEILDKSKLPDMLGFTGLYLLGGYFRRFGFSARRGWLAAGTVSALLSVIASQTVYAQNLLSFLSPNVVISGGACFVLYMTRSDVRENYRRPLRLAGECTMGVYLLHYLVSGLLTPWLSFTQSVPFSAAAMALRAVCVFAATMALVRLLRWIPFVRKWVL